MQPIELTDLHKSKLLEMCRILFPEYNRIEISDYQIDVDRNHYNPIFIDIYKGGLTVPFDIYSIHWFEFQWEILNKICMLYIKSPIKTNEQIKLFGLVCFNKSKLLHPIDYLYEQFKQLK